MPGESASLSIIKEFLNAAKPKLFTHYIDLKNESLATTALENAGKSYSTISKQISIVSSKNIRKGKEANISNDLIVAFSLYLVHTYSNSFVFISFLFFASTMKRSCFLYFFICLTFDLKDLNTCDTVSKNDPILKTIFGRKCFNLKMSRLQWSINCRA